MDPLIDRVLRTILSTRLDLFGENCQFVDFKEDDENAEWQVCGYQSSIRFGRIVYRCHQLVKLSDHLILKVTPPSVFMKDFSSLQFFNEVFFYTRILPFFEKFNEDVGRTFPKYYSSLLQYNVDSDGVVIAFENLQAKGYSLPKQKLFLDYDHLSLMVRKLGEFHAHSYRARQESPNKFHALTLCRLETNGVVLKQYPNIYPYASRCFEPLVRTHPTYKSKIENLRDKMTNNCDELFRKILLGGDEGNPTHVLCHGDFVRNNVLFQYENGKPTDMKIVDLADWRYVSPVIDLAKMLYLHADQRMRDENWDNLLDQYYSAVQNTFQSIKVPSKDSILMEFKTNVLNAYFTASFFIPELIIQENDDMPNKFDLIPKEYQDVPFSEVPQEIMNEVSMKLGGSKATETLSAVLKDMIDRGFV